MEREIKNPTKKRRNRPGKRQRDRMKAQTQDPQAAKVKAQPVIVDRYVYLKEGFQGITTPSGFYLRAGVNGRLSLADLTESGVDVDWLINRNMLGLENQPSVSREGVYMGLTRQE